LVISRAPIGFVGQVESLCFSADGSRVELDWQSNGGRAGGPVSFSFLAIDAKTAREIIRRAGLKRASLVLSSDARSLARVADASAVVVDDLAKNAVLTRLEGASDVVGMAFSPDGQWLFTTSQDFTVRRWPIPKVDY
jgi:WD40 repeat protein